MFSTYNYLKITLLFAGTLGVVQSLGWMGMTLAGIFAYYCKFDFSGLDSNYASLGRLTFYQTYFRGSCIQEDFPLVNFSAITEIDLMSAKAVHIWLWLYFSFNLIWLASSISLFVCIRKQFISYLHFAIYGFVTLTIMFSVLDLVVGILFGRDYDKLKSRAKATDYETGATGTIASVILSYAQTNAGIMMTVAFRGFLLWVINVAVACYLFYESFSVYKFNRTKTDSDDELSNTDYSTDVETYHRSKPIDMYSGPNSAPSPRAGFANTPRALTNVPYNNGDNNWRRSIEPVPLGRASTPPTKYQSALIPYQQQQQQPIRNSNQPIMSYQQPVMIPPAHLRRPQSMVRRDPASANVVRELQNRNSKAAGNPLTKQYPDPDYSPRPRTKSFNDRDRPLKSVLRNANYYN